MKGTAPFGPRSTADQVLAGIDLTGRRFVVTGCASGIGHELMNALASNGAHVIAMARTRAAAEAACERVGFHCTPLACDLGDLGSALAAREAIRALAPSLDGVIASAGVANLPTLQTHGGVERQFLVNHLGSFALLQGLADLVRESSGRIVIVSDAAAIDRAPTAGIRFDNLDGRHGYVPREFHGQSMLAAALHAKELSRRLAHRGIAVNVADPGTTGGTGIHRHLRGPRRAWALAARPFRKTPAQGAATLALLAASPRVAGISGEYFADCRPAPTPTPSFWHDAALGARLWEISENLLAAARGAATAPLRAAA